MLFSPKVLEAQSQVKSASSNFLLNDQRTCFSAHNYVFFQKKVFTTFGPLFQPKIMCSPKKDLHSEVVYAHQLGDNSGLLVYVTPGTMFPLNSPSQRP